MDCQLPDCEAVHVSENVKFGSHRGKDAVLAWESTYEDVVRWRRNLFMLPSGQAGKMFLEEMTKVASAWARGSPAQTVAMIMIMVMPALLLQKPSKRSKTADHIKALKTRLELWKEGKIEDLVNEAKAIQQRLEKSKSKQEQHEKVFVRLMLQGKVSSAMKWIGHGATTILNPSEEVVSQLITKHPSAKHAVDASILKGPHTSKSNL